MYKEMKVLLVLHLIYACIQDLLYQPNSSLSSEDYILLFTQLLATATCPSVRIHFLTTEPSPIPVSTLANFESIQVDCEGNTLKAVSTLRVETGTTADFSRCGFESEIKETLMNVEGKAVLTECWVQQLKGRGFEVNGELIVSTSSFEGNENSIFRLTRFGLSLSISNSQFLGNISPQGTILFFQPSGAVSNSTTWISFDKCEFQGNAASKVGSIMYVSIAPALFQLQESRTLFITNSAFMNSPGYLWYLQLRHLNVSFHNNTIQYAQDPIFLALFDTSFTMRNTSILYTSRPFFCSYVGGLVLIDGIRIEGVGNGPAVMVLNQAPFGLGQVILRNVDMAMVNQVDYSWFVSTIYSLAVPITVENVLIHSGFSFAAACGAYFFSMSVVNNCTVTNITVVQGGLIGHVFSQGTAYNLNETDCVTIAVSSILTLSSRVDFRNITFSISDAYMMPTNNGLFAFMDGYVNCTDVLSVVFPVRSANYMLLSNGKYYIARTHWNLIQVNSFMLVILAEAVVEDISAEIINIGYFVTVTSSSHLNLRNLTMINANIDGGLISANGHCTVAVSYVSISGGRAQSLVASSHSQVRMDAIVMNGIRGDALVYAYLER